MICQAHSCLKHQVVRSVEIIAKMGADGGKEAAKELWGVIEKSQVNKTSWQQNDVAPHQWSMFGLKNMTDNLQPHLAK